MEQVSKNLLEKIVTMLPKIKDRQAQFNEEELVPIKAFFEAITGVSIGNMMNCGGKLCEDVRRSISNYMASYRHIKTEAPKKEVKPLEAKKTPSKEVKQDERAELMAQALKIAEEKGIKKPHHKSGEDKLKAYINENS